MKMKGISFLKEVKNLKGKRVLLRLGLDVPIEGQRVVDGSRIRRALPTIAYLKKRGAKTIILSHIGREQSSLKPVVRRLNAFIKTGFIPEMTGARVKSSVGRMQDGSILMLENLRRNPGEEKNDSAFTRELASLGDLYVNDAFSVSHRFHASIIGLPEFLPSYAGFLFADEIRYLSLARAPKRPFIFILGGAKFETKISLIKKYLKKADIVFVGGALASQFFLEMGLPVGKSFVSKERFGLSALSKSKRLLLPIDVAASTPGGTKILTPEKVTSKSIIVDAGPKSLESLEGPFARAKLIVMNGPLGTYERGFDKGTTVLLKMIAESKALSIVGGGDTLALVSRLRLEKKYTFVSTGGGAMIEFLAEGTLPGIEALRGRGTKK